MRPFRTVTSSGNRDGVGQSKKVHYNIKHKALHEINSFDNIHKNLLTLQEKLKKNSETECLAKGLAFRKISGFIQSITSTQTKLKVVLFNESSVRLYHHLSKKELLGIDATGSVVRKVNKNFPVSDYESISFWEILSSAWCSTYHR